MGGRSQYARKPRVCFPAWRVVFEQDSLYFAEQSVKQNNTQGNDCFRYEAILSGSCWRDFVPIQSV